MCPRCGHWGEAAEPTVSVQTMILSLGRFGIASGKAKALRNLNPAATEYEGNCV
jgi:hypothetical protein